jgi:hypothetical protein
MNLIKPILLAYGLTLAGLAFSQNKPSESTGTQSTNIRSYTTQRLTTVKPVVDGKLDDACWKTGEWDGNFIQWIPKEGAAPSQPTYLKILYDDKNIYVAIRAVDREPDKISQRSGRRDELTGDEAGICFDSYHDHRTGFEFDLSAAGQKTDMILTNPMNSDNNWNAVWTGKTGLEDSAWVAEYEIPLSQLRYSSEEVQTWGIHCWRWIDRLQEESDWEPQTSTGPGMLYLFGHLNGIQDLPKSRRIEIMPYALGKLNTFKKQAGNPFASSGNKWSGAFGLDAKIGLSSNFTANVAINPDFGQVESDPSVMNLTAYETFYEEKRPFFLEGSNIFKYEFNDANLFYSRRIGHAPTYYPALGTGDFIDYPQNTSILSAVKISGKTSNGFSVGILHSITSKEDAEISSGGKTQHVSVEPPTSYTVARVQQDFNEGTTVLGGILTSTNRFLNEEKFNFLNHNAFTGGVDLLHQWHDKEFYLDARLVASTIQGDSSAIKILQQSSARFYQRPDAGHLKFDPRLTALSGQGGSIKIGKGSKGNLRYSTMINWSSPGLELNDIGYMQSADLFKNTNTISYSINQPQGKFRQLYYGFTEINNWDYAFNYLSSQFNPSFSGQFLNKLSVNAHVCYFPNSLDTRILRGGNAMKVPSRVHGNVGFNTDYSRKAQFSFNIFYEAGGKSSSSTYTISPGFNYRPIGTLKFSVSAEYSANQNELQYVQRVSIDQKPAYLLGKIDQHTLSATFRIDYNISPELSIQYYGSPFASTGNFSRFKHVNNPLADKLTDRYELLAPTLNGKTYTSGQFSFDNPDFAFTQFRSNMVFRWEYRPGSQLFLVWSNERTDFRNISGSNLHDAFSGLRKVFPNNLFLIKLSYWLPI